MLGVLIYTFYFVGYVQESGEECEGAVREPNANERRAYLYHAITVAALLIACIVTTYVGIKEQEGDHSSSKLFCHTPPELIIIPHPTFRGSEQGQENQYL